MICQVVIFPKGFFFLVLFVKCKIISLPKSLSLGQWATQNGYCQCFLLWRTSADRFSWQSWNIQPSERSMVEYGWVDQAYGPRQQASLWVDRHRGLGMTAPTVLLIWSVCIFSSCEWSCVTNLPSQNWEWDWWRTHSTFISRNQGLHTTFNSCSWGLKDACWSQGNIQLHNSTTCR